MENENVNVEINENVEVKETKEVETKNEMVVSSSINDISNITKSKSRVFTTITDDKMLFNLESNCDNKINDCVGETIRVKDIYIKLIETPLEEVKVNEETGDVVDTEFKKITILVDDNNKSYVTASKMFANQLIKYIQMCGLEKIETEGLDIKIIKRNVRNSSNQALGFELV